MKRTPAVPFASALARRLWRTRQLIRIRPWLTEGDSGATLARIDQVEHLAVQRSAALLVERLLDCGAVSLLLAREENGMVQVGGQRRRFWTPFPELYRLLMAAVHFLGTDAVPHLLRAGLRESLHPVERGVLMEMIAGSNDSRLGDLSEAIGRGQWDVSAIEVALERVDESEPEPPMSDSSIAAWRELEFAAMLQALEDEDYFERCRAVDALAAGGDPRAIPAVTLLVDDPHEDIRLAVIRALAQLHRNE